LNVLWISDASGDFVDALEQPARLPSKSGAANKQSLSIFIFSLEKTGEPQTSAHGPALASKTRRNSLDFALFVLDSGPSFAVGLGLAIIGHNSTRDPHSLLLKRTRAPFIGFIEHAG
jgi:hypothetical protein